MKLWDWALDHGVKGTKACQTILKFIILKYLLYMPEGSGRNVIILGSFAL